METTRKPRNPLVVHIRNILSNKRRTTTPKKAKIKLINIETLVNQSTKKKLINKNNLVQPTAQT